jgi:predicted unusual protein kinase regulating ubiquinone biosynthesis (AarF/ABC1/UbiB family)
MKKNKKYSRKWRIRKAYWTTIVILISYWRLSLISKIRGKDYYQRKVVDLNIKNANRIKNAILELEGLFIKVGQLLSILTNFLPEAYHEPLQSLQDQLPAKPFVEIQQRIQQELGKSIDELFAEFNPTPIATASIGQAHRARLHDGTDVVVKVQHLNIEDIAEVDLEIIEHLVNLSARFYKVKGIEYAYTQVEQMIIEELDFKTEAESMITIGKNLENEDLIVIPKVQKEYSTNRVLVTTFCEGVKISDIQQIEDWSIDKTDLTKRLLNVYCKMVLDDGFYHADPHPGNILVQSNGAIVLLDFGAVSNVQESLRIGIPRLIEGVAKKDNSQVIEALRYMDFIPDSKEAEAFAEKIIVASRHFIEQDIKMEGMDLSKIKDINPFDNSLFDLTNEIGLSNIINTVQVPKDYVLLNRTATLLLGIASALDSTLNPLTVVRPYIQQLVFKEKGNIAKQITNKLQTTLMSAVSLPDTLNDTFSKLQRGQIEIKTAGKNEQTKLMYAIGQQLVLSLLAITAFIIGYWSRSNHDFEFSKYSFIASAILLIVAWRTHRKTSKIRKML